MSDHPEAVYLKFKLGHISVYLLAPQQRVNLIVCNIPAQDPMPDVSRRPDIFYQEHLYSEIP